MNAVAISRFGCVASLVVGRESTDRPPRAAAHIAPETAAASVAAIANPRARAAGCRGLRAGCWVLVPGAGCRVTGAGCAGRNAVNAVNAVIRDSPGRAGAAAA